MQRLDAAAIETLGIPRLLLMEHAGLAVARAAHTHASDPAAPVAVCCGTGFNGGDGLSAARHLQAWGHPLRVLLAGPRGRLREEPAVYAAILERLGVVIQECTEPAHAIQAERWLSESGVVIDALLGIGIRGAVRDPAAWIIRCINASGRPVIAADVPSGVDADTGVVQGVAVRATATVTFGLPKQGCFLHDGPAHTGSLIVDSITIPPTLLEAATR